MVFSYMKRISDVAKLHSYSFIDSTTIRNTNAIHTDNNAAFIPRDGFRLS